MFLYGFADAVAIPRAYYGKGTGLIVFSHLECTGMESSLSECDHDGIGYHHCSHGEDAGVICQGNVVHSVAFCVFHAPKQNVFSDNHTTARQ